MCFVTLFFGGIQKTEEKQDWGMWMMNNLGIGNTCRYGMRMAVQMMN